MGSKGDEGVGDEGVATRPEHLSLPGFYFSEFKINKTPPENFRKQKKESF